MCISFSNAAPMVIIGNCKCVFGPHFNSSFHNARRDRKTQYAASHTGELKSESAALKVLLKA